MPLSVVVDDELLEQAMRVGPHRTGEAVVAAALREYIRHHKQLEILNLCRTIDFDPNYDYKRERRRRAGAEYRIVIPRQLRTWTTHDSEELSHV